MGVFYGFVSPSGGFFILYIIYSEIGAVGIYYIGLPIISISIILMLFYSSRKINYYLKNTSEIGHELTGQLKVDEVIDLFIKRITTLLSVDYAYIYNVEDSEKMKMIRFYDAKGDIESQNLQLRKNQGVSGKVWVHNKGLRYTNKKQLTVLESKYLPSTAESIISLPIERNKEVVGVITLVSCKKRAYEKSQYMILDILTNYLAVAIESARNYEKTRLKSERCPLTNLYNYRYFVDYLEKYYVAGNHDKVEHISLIILDIDYFKDINDTYGHQSGNEILQELANRLTDTVSEQGIVSRYGGEEFVILLPKLKQNQCYNLAESVRKTISDKPFVINDHILNVTEPVEVQVTVSVGVATYPDNCGDPFELARHADRAMYVGAKQKGQNRVAVYEKMVINTAE